MINLNNDCDQSVLVQTLFTFSFYFFFYKSIIMSLKNRNKKKRKTILAVQSILQTFICCKPVIVSYHATFMNPMNSSILSKNKVEYEKVINNF